MPRWFLGSGLRNVVESNSVAPLNDWIRRSGRCRLRNGMVSSAHRSFNMVRETAFEIRIVDELRAVDLLMLK